MEHLTRHVALVPVQPEHYQALYGIVADAEHGWRFRFRGSTPSPEAFAARLWDGVLAQYLVVGRESHRLRGLVQLYNYSGRGRHCYAAAVSAPSALGTGLVVEGFLALVELAFRTFELRKLYVEVLGFNLEAFQRIDEYFVEEGRLAEHEWHDGQWWDLVTLALYRDTWYSEIKPRIEVLLAPLDLTDAEVPARGEGPVRS